jgi:hypothetical protein
MKKKLLFLGILFIIVTMVIGSFVRNGIDESEKARFNEMIDGTAYKPFVERAIVPLVIRAIVSLLPYELIQKVNSWGSTHIKYLSSNGRDIKFVTFIIAVAIWYISIMGFAITQIKLTNFFYSVSDNFALSLAIISVAGLPIFFKYYSHIYDFTQLFLFTLTLYLLAKQKWGLYLLLFALASLSKETTILAVIIYFLYYRSILSRQLFIKLLISQLILFAIIRFSLLMIYFNNKGGVVEFPLVRNLSMEPFSFSQFVSFVFVGILLIYDWKGKPLFLRTSLSIAIPLVLLGLLFGRFDEYRIYYEVYSIVLLLLAYSIDKILSGIQSDVT